MRNRRTRTNIAVIILAMIFCVVALGGTEHFVCTHRQTEIRYSQLEPEACVQSGTFHDLAGKQAELDALARGGVLTFSINVTPPMRVGETKINLLIEDPPDNGSRLAVTVNREDTEEEIYKPGYLDPEQYVEGAPLNVGPPTEEYPCVANSDAYRISGNVCTGEASAHIILYVQN